MKKKIITFIILFMPVIMFAQSVAINNDASAPDNSALLDIKSTTKGLLMPRMNSAERIAIGSPALGLTVFDTNTYSYWVYRGALNNGWVELVHSQQNYWTPTGTHIYNNNLGNVGIGTSTPASKLTINGADPMIGLLNNGIATGYIQANGNNINFGTHPDNVLGNFIFQPKGIDRVWINQLGKVGIGTGTSLSAELTLNGNAPVLQMQINNANIGYLNSNASNLVLSTNQQNITGSLLLQTKQRTGIKIDEAGKVGIGTNSSTDELTLNGIEPIFQLRNDDINKGFIQLVGDDIRIGTNLSNVGGEFKVRTKGFDRFSVDGNGNTTIGNSTTGALYIDADNPSIYMRDNGVTKGSLHFNNDNDLTLYNLSGGGKLKMRAGINGLNLDATGHLNIGTGKTPPTYKLSVEGKVIAIDYVALPVNNWPDYVFAKDYKLRTLAEVKKFIAENNHLPGIPTAAEIEKDGVQLGDMSRRLIEKVEELTLYILQQQEQIDALKNKIK